jgi:hypothetical protein
VDPKASPVTFLRSARSAVESNRPGEAEEALERAETRLLDRPLLPAAAQAQDQETAVLDIGVARRDLAARDLAGVLGAIDDALRVLETSTGCGASPDRRGRWRAAVAAGRSH